MGMNFRMISMGSSRGSLDDLHGKKLINHNRCSGTRTLLDKLLEGTAKKQGISKVDLVKNIPEYNSGSRTHRSVCEVVKSGKAEVGLDIRPFAEAMALPSFSTFTYERTGEIIKDI